MLLPSVVCQQKFATVISDQLQQTKSEEPGPEPPASPENADAHSPTQPHKLQKKSFFAPTWCDNCDGILVGAGYKCTCCGRKCHLGLGKGSENCKADLLLMACGPVCRSRSQIFKADSKKRYEFGDVSRQLVRNAHQTIKDVVVKETMKEQQAWGKFDLLRWQVLELERRWDSGIFVKWFVGSQIVLMVAIWAITFSTVEFLARGLATESSTRHMANAQAMCAIRSLLLMEMLVLIAVRVAAGRAFQHSELIFTFIKEILHVDMAELADIQIGKAATAVQRAADRFLVFLSVIFVLTVALGLKSISSQLKLIK